MVSSQNGWSAPGRSVIATYTVPGTTLRIPLRKGDVSVVLLDFLARYHREVESLYHNPQDLWGYADRTVRGSSTTVSNHASGTAADHRAVDHPLGVRGTFTTKEVRALEGLLASYDGVLRHGKDYKGRADEMHVEVNASAAAVKRVADRIRSGQTSPAAPADPSLLRRGSTGDAVRDLQRALGIAVDGDFGPATETAVRAFQAAHGLAADGIAGPDTLSALTPRKDWFDMATEADLRRIVRDELRLPLPRGGGGQSGTTSVVEVARWSDHAWGLQQAATAAASRDVASLRAEVAALASHVAELTAAVRAGGGTGAPGLAAVYTFTGTATPKPSA